MTDVEVQSGAGNATGHDGPPVELVIPADTRSVRLARLVTSGVATASGFDVEEVEDLRIAVNELCAVLLGCGAREVLRLAWRSTAGGIEMVGSAAVDGSPRPPDELSLQVLDVVADLVERLDVDGQVSYRLVRRREVTSAG